MTYSPFIETAHWDGRSQPDKDVANKDVTDESVIAQRALSESDWLLRRVSGLLHCPIDTVSLWPELLNVLVNTFHCSAAQLLWTHPVATRSTHQYGEEIVAPDKVQMLWQYLDLPGQLPVDPLWFALATELQAQLAALVFDSVFQLSGTRLYAANQWPLQIKDMVSASADRQLLVLPLRYAGDCAGVLLLTKQDAQSWLPREIDQVEVVGSQIYLAIRRACIERLFRSRSARDQLTQLPDRMLFTQQLTQAIAQAIDSDVMLGVAFLDLDRFKTINDTLGHAVGDCLLKQVAERLQSCLRSYDVVARWGGDEFTLLLAELRSPEEISNIAERILQRLAAPFRVQGQELFVTASLGIALAPYDGEDEQTLLCNADAAMYQAKARGRNNYQIYFEEINADARTQLNLETDLRKALDSQELFLCYQPQVDLRSGQWIGMEALIRWNHPTLGLIPPSKFIPIAEETGLIERIGQWVLEAACAQYGQWQKMGLPPLRLAVNLSAQQFHRASLVRSVVETLEAANFDPRYLELEVTESAAMHDVGFAISVLKKLSLAGIQIAMDDFGTGYSSLSVLKHFPLDTIKIDRSFVQDLVDSPSDAAIASTIIALAKGLDFKVLAEGIETPEQMAVLNEMGCDYAQGYWFSRPLNVVQINEMLEQGSFYEIAGLL